MTATLRELIVKISADSSVYQREMGRATRMGSDYYRSMESGSRRAQAAIGVDALGFVLEVFERGLAGGGHGPGKGIDQGEFHCLGAGGTYQQQRGGEKGENGFQHDALHGCCFSADCSASRCRTRQHCPVRNNLFCLLCFFMHVPGAVFRSHQRSSGELHTW